MLKTDLLVDNWDCVMDETDGVKNVDGPYKYNAGNFLLLMKPSLFSTNK